MKNKTHSPEKSDSKPSNASFIQHAFSSLRDDERVIVTGFHGDPLKVDYRSWFGRAFIPGSTPCIQDSHNNFVAVSAFKKDAGNIARRRKSQFSRMFAVMIDDIGTKIDPKNLMLTPSVRVETSPANFQDWYFLDPPIEDRGLAEALVKGMIANGLTAGGIDPGMRGVTRYGRLPIGVNGKEKYRDKYGNSFVQSVPIWSPNTRYSLEDIANAYGVNLYPKLITKTALIKKRILTASSNMEGEIIDLLHQSNLYIEPIGDGSGAHRIECPWVYEHSDEDPTGTVYFEPSDENNWRGGFKCHHGHCQMRNMSDLTHFLNQLIKISQVE